MKKRCAGGSFASPKAVPMMSILPWSTTCCGSPAVRAWTVRPWRGPLACRWRCRCCRQSRRRQPPRRRSWPSLPCRARSRRRARPRAATHCRQRQCGCRDPFGRRQQSCRHVEAPSAPRRWTTTLLSCAPNADNVVLSSAQFVRTSQSVAHTATLCSVPSALVLGCARQPYARTP